MEAWKEINLEKLKNVIGDVDLTESERKTLEWLSGWESETIRDLVSIIQKARTTKPIKPSIEKREVWIVTVFFTEESGLPVSEEYTADSYGEIEKLKKQIRRDYSPEEIESIIVSDDPEIREFYV